MTNICLILNSYNKSCNTQRYIDSPLFLTRLKIVNKLKSHNGCVNSLAWNSDGGLLLSGSDDKCIGITNYSSKNTKLFSSGHSSNIFCARFLSYSNDHEIISCAGDGNIILNNIEIKSSLDLTYSNESLTSSNLNKKFNCHVGAVYKVLPYNLSHGCFISCGEDGTIRLFDTRIKESCDKNDCLENIIIQGQQAISCVAIDPLFPAHIMGGFVDSSVRIFDYRMLGSSPNTYEQSLKAMYGFYRPPNMNKEYRRITSLAFDPSTKDLLTSYSGSYIHMINQQQNVDNFNHESVNGLLDPDLMTLLNLETSDQKPMSFNSSNFQVRLRGDWSDTGPSSHLPTTNVTTPSISPNDPIGIHNAYEAEGRRRRFRSILLNQVTNMFNQMLNSRLNHRTNPQSAAILPLCLQGCESPTWSYVADNHVTDDQSGSGSTNADSLKSGVKEGGGIQIKQPKTSNNSATNFPGTSNKATTIDTISKNIETPDNKCSPTARSSIRNQMSDNETYICKEQFKETPKINCQKYMTKRIFSGHRNARTMIKEVNFWGDKYIISGSDCGHVFFWDRATGHVVKVIEADRHVVNCVQPHPNLLTLATSGIDYDIKLIEPSEDFESPPPLDPKVYVENEMVKRLEENRKIKKLCETNGVMLQQNRDIVTVPASFMIRMLAQMQRSNNNQTENEP